MRLNRRVFLELSRLPTTPGYTHFILNWVLNREICQSILQDGHPRQRLLSIIKNSADGPVRDQRYLLKERYPNPRSSIACIESWFDSINYISMEVDLPGEAGRVNNIGFGQRHIQLVGQGGNCRLGKH